jgi:hypothetical protein
LTKSFIQTKKVNCLLVLCLFSIQLVLAQDIQEIKNEDFLQEIINVIAGQSEIRSINQYKHINQVVALKDGLWIEPDRRKLWFISYLDGKKHGKFYCYDLDSDKKELEGKYQHDVLTDTLVIYDGNGNIYSIYSEIKQSTQTLNINYEYPVGESFKFFNEPYRFSYEAMIQRFTEEGSLYAEGMGAFEDQLTCVNHDPEKPGLGYRTSFSIFRIYKFGDWKNY